jgi:diacylglycerol kinase family enzyme
MIAVILNPHSGFVKAHGIDAVRAMIDEAVPSAQIHILQLHDDLAALCKSFVASGAECIAAAGGDGTVGSVAAQLVGTETPLGVIPGGTLNHFARDVGVGRHVSSALQVLGGGYSLPVDVASVNGHIFLNNSSIGLYPQMVAVRERYERRMSKSRAMMHAALLVARHAKEISVDLSSGDDTLHIRTRLLFVGNNQYELNLLSLGQRQRLDAGELWCIVLDSSQRFRLIPNLFAFLRGRHPHERFFQAERATRLVVRPKQRPRQVEVSADGEVLSLSVPLEYRVLPQALKVVVPEPPPRESREMRGNAAEHMD